MTIWRQSERMRTSCLRTGIRIPIVSPNTRQEFQFKAYEGRRARNGAK